MEKIGVAALAVLALLWGSPCFADRADRRLLEQALAAKGLAADQAQDDARLLDEIVETFAEYYVEPKPAHDLAGLAAAGLTKSTSHDWDDLRDAAMAELSTVLDPHSRYLTPEEWRDMNIAVSGRFSGIGMELTMRSGFAVVVTPIDGSPAAAAGIQPDDAIIAVDGENMAGLSLLEVVKRIRGPKGKSVLLQLRNPKGGERSISVVRDAIRLHPVKGRLDGDVAYVRISQFTGGVAGQLRSELMDLNRQAAFGIKGLVLDLRRNPGGLLDEAVKTADLFLDDVAIVSTRGRDPRNDEHLNGRTGQILAGVPMAVLIDGGSASASEIVAGALHDNNRAVLVGEKSYGKGSVQMLQDVSQGGVRVTVARYFRPSNAPVDGIGLSPDLAVPMQDGADHQLLQAVEWVRQHYAKPR